MSTLRKAWKKLKKVPIIGWVVFVVLAVLVGVWLFFRKTGGGLGAFLAPSPRVEPPGPPAITPEEAEEQREVIAEELTVVEEKAETEAEALKRRAREKFGEIE